MPNERPGDQSPLQPSNHLAKKLMDAETKAHLSARLSLDLEAIRFDPLRRITIRRRQEEKNFHALRQQDTVQLDIPRGGAEKCLHGGIPA